MNDEPVEEHTRSGVQRREEDQTVSEALFTVSDFLHKVKPLALLLVTILSMSAAAAAWFGVQNAVPNRINRLELKLDSGLTDHDKQIRLLKEQQERVKDDFSNVDEKLDLLLRVTCRNVARSDLIRSCQPFINNLQP